MDLLRCQDAVEVMTDYMEGALAPREQRSVSRHLAGCEGCATYLRQLRRTVQALRMLGAED